LISQTKKNLTFLSGVTRRKFLISIFFADGAPPYSHHLPLVSSDMEGHYSMADALVSDLNWKAPLRDTRGDDNATKRAVAAARRDASILERSGIGAAPERSHLSRKARIFIGRKGAVSGAE
jgi:hypothetical protein